MMDTKDILAYAAILLSTLTALTVARQTFRFNSLLKQTETVYKLKHDSYTGFITLIVSWMGEQDTTSEQKQLRFRSQEELFEVIRRAWLFAPRDITRAMRQVIDLAFKGEFIDEPLRDLVLAMRKDLSGNDQLERELIVFDIVVDRSRSTAA